MVVSKRRDAPPVYRHTRGNKKLALEVAADGAAMEAAIIAYERDWVSAGDTG